MALIALVSAKSSGVTATTAALALASRRPVLLAELDLSGGSLRHGLLRDVRRGEQELDGSTGVHRLPQADWERAEGQEFTPAVSAHLWPLDGSDYRFALPGVTDPRQAASLTQTWPALGNVLHLIDQRLGWDVLVDAGRLVLHAGQPHPVLSPLPVLRTADLVLVTVRATEESLVLARPVVEALSGHGTRGLGLLLLGPGAFRRQDVERELEAPVLGTLPWDERTAAYLTGRAGMPRGFSRSALMRGARAAMGPLREYADRRRLHQQMSAAHTAATPAMNRMLHQLAQRQGGSHG
ncbi:hypothetical protein ACFQ7N_10040 [Streptomyces niveus]|uniref:hypothetical protein n=1 Tax=Streptomyces niveus TaxID=193462 RepID=UPI0036947942